MSRKVHAVQDASHDGYEVSTFCGKDGWRTDGLSEWYAERGKDRMFIAAFEVSRTTCKRCEVARTALAAMEETET